MKNYVKPSAKSTKSYLVGLITDGIEVSDGEEVASDGAYIANYVSEEGTVAVCIADLSLVCFAGAALMQIPPAVAKESISDKDPTNVMIDCFYEVTNILSRVFMDEKSDHLKLTTLSKPGDDVSFMSAINDEAETVSFNVEIPGYGTGGLTYKIAA